MAGKVLTGAVALLVIAPSGAQAQSDFVVGFGPGFPDGSAAVSFDVRYRNASDPNGKPPAVTAARFRLPAGTRIDTAAAPRCNATNEELQARGTRACPAATRVGGGTLTAVTGFGPPADPVEGEVTVFNGAGELIEVVAVPGTDRVVGLDRLAVDGDTLKANPPAIPGGPPDGRTAVKDIRLKIDRPRYVTPPRECRVGRWPYGASFAFADGTRQQVSHTHPCATPVPPVAPPAMKLSVRPRRARAKRRTTFRFRVTSPARRCIRGAKVRFASKRARTNRRGRARITTTIHRARRLPMNVSKRGCRTARGWVRILR